MQKLPKYIEIVSSSKRGLSSMSQRSRESILDVLSKQYAWVKITLVDNLADLEALAARKPDLVFLGMQFIPSTPGLGRRDPDKIWLAKYLEEHNITSTGSDHNAHKLELNKHLAKQRVLDAGLTTSRFNIIGQNEVLTSVNLALAFPVFIKPTNLGGGVGIDSASVAHNFDQLSSKVHTIRTGLRADSLVESYLTGREFSVAVLKDEDSDHFSVMPIELVAPQDKHGRRILSRRVKSADAEVVSEVTDDAVRNEICKLALDVFQALGARDYGRIDIRLDGSGVAHFLEANLIPSLIRGYGSFPKACALNIDMDYETMILQIVTLALARELTIKEEIFEKSESFRAAALPLEPIFEL